MLKCLRYGKIVSRLTILILIMLGVNQVNLANEKKEIGIIPKPLKYLEQDGEFQLNKETILCFNDDKQLNAVQYLSNLLKWEQEIKVGSRAKSNCIRFINSKRYKKEAYQLNITKEEITITASSGAGFFYAVQTIRQLLPVAVEKDDAQKEFRIPCALIEDQPRFEWRGMHMDFSRHFFDVKEVKDFLEHMALYKLNKFHMHLTDDQGWRVEIKKYPLLTKQGAWRKPSRHDVECNKRSVDDKLLVIDENKFKLINGQKLYGGFFTQEEIKEIVEYAAERHIEVIPEIDVPGHFRAAMDQYPHFTCFGKSGQGISNANRSIPACLGNPEAYQFIKDILTEVGELFPSQYIHIGGDEVLTENWEVCPKCQKVVKEHHLESAHELQSFFNRDIEAFLKEKGKKVIGWDEIVLGGISESATMMWWRSFRKEGHDAVKKCIENGNEMVFAPLNPYYFDYGNGADGTEKVYNKSKNIIPDYVTKKQEKLIKGIQACLWAEYLPNYKRFEYMAYPRMLALAETAWSPVEVQEWNDFKNRLEIHYPRLDKLDVNYALRKIEGMDRKMIVTDSLSIELSTKEPGAKIYYSLNGYEPVIDELNLYTAPIKIADNATINAVAVKNGKKDKIYKSSIVKQEFLDGVQISNALPKGLKCWEFESATVNDDVICELECKTVSEISPRKPTNGGNYSMLFKGYIKIDKTGIYNFSTGLRGESYVHIDNFLVIENTLHKGSSKGQVALKQGLHKIIMRFENVKSGSKLKVDFQLENNKKKSVNKLIYL